MKSFGALLSSATPVIGALWAFSVCAQTPECSPEHLDQEMKRIGAARVSAGPSLYQGLMVYEREKTAFQNYRRCADLDPDVAIQFAIHLYARGSASIQVYSPRGETEEVAQGFREVGEAREWLIRAAQRGRYSAWRLLGDMSMDAQVGTPSPSVAAEHYARCSTMAAPQNREYALLCYDLLRKADSSSPLASRVREMLYPPEPVDRPVKSRRRSVM